MASADGNAVPPTDAMDTAPTLCAKGCGFFGNASTGGMCSKCYKETIAKAAVSAPSTAVAAVSPAAKEEPPIPPTVTPTPPPAAPLAATEDTTTTEEVASSSSMGAIPAAEPAVPASTPPLSAQVRPAEADNVEDEPPKKVQVNTSRCWTCNRKIGLTGFQCKCEYFFCASHRYSDRHECAFDYKAQGKQLLTKANPTIAPSKMESM